MLWKVEAKLISTGITLIRQTKAKPSAMLDASRFVLKFGWTDPFGRTLVMDLDHHAVIGKLHLDKQYLWEVESANESINHKWVSERFYFMCPCRRERFQESKSSVRLRLSATQMLRCIWRPCKRRFVDEGPWLWVYSCVAACIWSQGVILVCNLQHRTHLTFSFLPWCGARLFVQSGIDMEKLLVAKKKRDAPLMLKQEKEKEEAKKQVYSEMAYSLSYT